MRSAWNVRRAGWGPPGRRPTAPTMTPASWSVVVIGRLPNDGARRSGATRCSPPYSKIRSASSCSESSLTRSAAVGRRPRPSACQRSVLAIAEPALRGDPAASSRPRGRRASPSTAPSVSSSVHAGEAVLHGAEARSVRRQPLGGHGDGARVAIDADDALHAGVQQRLVRARRRPASCRPRCPGPEGTRSPRPP